MTKTSFIKPANPRILKINNVPSDIRFALAEAGDALYGELMYWSTGFRRFASLRHSDIRQKKARP